MSIDANGTLGHRAKAGLEEWQYTFTLELQTGETAINNKAHKHYLVSIQNKNKTNTYYLTVGGYEGISLVETKAQAKPFLIHKANVYDNYSGGGKIKSYLCLFYIDSSTDWNGNTQFYGRAVEYEWTTLKLCAENDKNKSGWDACSDAYELKRGEGGNITPPTAKVTITKVFSGMDAEDIPADFTIQLKGTKDYTLKKEGATGYTYSETVEAGEYEVVESNYTNDKYNHTGTTLTNTTSNTTVEPDSNSKYKINVVKDQDMTFTLTNTYEKQKDPKASKAEKEVVCNSRPDGVTLPEGVTVTYPKTENGVIQPILIEEGTTSVTLLYKITVTGDKGAKFTVTDEETTLVYPTGEGAAVTTKSSGVYEGTLPTESTTDKATLEFYVTKTFDSFPDNSGYLTNNVSLTGGNGDEEKVPYEKEALVTITKQFVGLDNVTKPTLTIELENTVEGVSPERVTLSETSTGTYVYSGRVPAGTYKVKETLGTVQYYTLDSTELKNGNDTVRDLTFEVKNGETHSYTLVNTYSKNNPDNATFNPGDYIVKKLEGELPTAGTFEVNVTTGGTTKKGTVSLTTGTQAFTFSDSFSLSEDTTFEVAEVIPANADKIANVTYNNTTYELKVTIKVDETTNKYVVDTVSWREGDTGDFKVLGANDKLEITNTYTAPATTAAVTITKTFEGLPEGAALPNVAIYLRNTSTDQLYRLAKADDSFIYTGSVPAGTYAIAENNNNYPGYAQTAIRLKDGNGTIEIKESDYGTTVEFELVNVYEKIEKTPATVNFSDLIQKKLTIKGDYIFTGETFHAKMRYKAKEGFGEDAWYEFKAEFGKNTKSGAVKEFVIDSGVGDDGADYIVTFPKAGEYVFYLFEYKDGKSGVTYDESFYEIFVKVEEAANNRLKVTSISYFKYANEDKLKNKEPESSTYTVLYMEGELTGKTITFYNTVNTGKKGDHIKIDSPNKLNTDDHYAYIIGYPDGTVQPNGEITRAEVATIFFRLLKDDVREKYFTKTNDFSDVSRSDWFNNPVSTMAELGIVKGYPDGTFRPNEPITRAEFAAIAARFDASTRYGETRFTDVAGHWAIREIAKAYNNGWIKGYPDNTFRPNRNITRAEAMTLINRVLNRAPETEKDLLSNMNKWSDNMDVDAWYYLAVQEATNSHDYRRKSSSYEHWIRMLEDPNWEKYER